MILLRSLGTSILPCHFFTLADSNSDYSWFYFRPRTEFDGRLCFYRCRSVKGAGGRGVGGVGGTLAKSRPGGTPNYLPPQPGPDGRGRGGTQSTYPPSRSRWGERVPQGTYPWLGPDRGRVPQGTYLPPAKVPTPHPGPHGGGGTPRYLPHSQGIYPPARSRQGGEGWPDPDRGRVRKVPTPSPQPRYLPPSRSTWGRGYPKVPTPPPPPPDRTACGVLDTPRSVCLLRSRRRTVLWYFTEVFTPRLYSWCVYTARHQDPYSDIKYGLHRIV